MIKTDLPQPHAASLRGPPLSWLGRRLQFLGVGELYNGQSQNGTINNGNGEKGNVCGKMEEKNGHGNSALREELKRYIRELSDENLKNLWDAITSGVFDVPAEDT